MSTVEKGDAFEIASAETLRMLGYRIKRNVLVEGNQLDLIAERSTAGIREKYIVECKDYNKSPSIEIVRSFFATITAVRKSEPAATGLLITRLPLTKEAKAFATAVGIQYTTLAELEENLIDLKSYSERLIADFEDSTLARHFIPLEVSTSPHTVRKRFTNILSDASRTYYRALSTAYHSGALTISPEDLIDLATSTAVDTPFLRRLLYQKMWMDHHGQNLIEDLNGKAHADEAYMLDLSTGPLETMSTDSAILEFVGSAREQVCILLGDYGTGKTSTLRYVAAQMAKRYLAGEASACPILIQLRRFPAGVTENLLLSEIAQLLEQPTLNWRILQRYIANGRLVLLMDGFDEMGLQVDARIRQLHFASLLKLVSSPKAKMVLTGRAAYFPNDAELHAVEKLSPFHENQPISGDSNLPTLKYTIAPLTDRKISDYLASYENELSADALAGLKWAIGHVYNLRDLANRPFLLNLIVETVPLISGNVHTITPAYLYSVYTHAWLDRDYKKGEFRWLIDRAQKESFMKELAWTMLHTRSLTIHFSELADYAAEFFSLTTADRIDHFAHDLRTCSFLIRDDEGNYYFVHRSFQEYFAALQLVEKLGGEPENTRDSMRSLMDGIDIHRLSRNTLAFALDLVGEDVKRTRKIVDLVASAERDLLTVLERLGPLPKHLFERLCAGLLGNERFGERMKTLIALGSSTPVIGKRNGVGTRRVKRTTKRGGKKSSFCSFCARTKSDVARFVSGPSVQICSYCVGEARLYMAIKLADSSTEHADPAKRCSFCDRDGRFHKALVRDARSSCSICNDCVKVCADIIEKQRGAH